jgi:hypothetical protein
VRNMSFALTIEQVRNKTKTVTRRTGWATLKPGTLLQPVLKGMGLKKGEKAEKIGGPIRVVSVRREPLMMMDQADCAREGFPEMTVAGFMSMFCASHRVVEWDGWPSLRNRSRSCEPRDEVTRIEFEYL